MQKTTVDVYGNEIKNVKKLSNKCGIILMEDVSTEKAKYLARKRELKRIKNLEETVKTLEKRLELLENHISFL